MQQLHWDGLLAAEPLGGLAMPRECGRQLYIRALRERIAAHGHAPEDGCKLCHHYRGNHIPWACDGRCPARPEREGGDGGCNRVMNRYGSQRVIQCKRELKRLGVG